MIASPFYCRKSSPEKPGFTGTDAIGHHWVSGKQVAAPEEAAAPKPSAPAQQPPQQAAAPDAKTQGYVDQLTAKFGDKAALKVAKMADQLRQIPGSEARLAALKKVADALNPRQTKKDVKTAQARYDEAKQQLEDHKTTTDAAKKRLDEWGQKQSDEITANRDAKIAQIKKEHEDRMAALKAKQDARKTGGESKPGATTANTQTPPGWTPTKSVSDADAWAKGSTITQTLYHGTSADVAAKIKESGFTPGRSAFGTGVYLSQDKGFADGYQRGVKDGKGATVETKINVDKMLPIKDSPQGYDKAAKMLGMSKEQFAAATQEQLPKTNGSQLQAQGEAIRQAAEKQGYHGLNVDSSKPFYVVFDPKRVTTIDPGGQTAKPEPKPIPTPLKSAASPEIDIISLLKEADQGVGFDSKKIDHLAESLGKLSPAAVKEHAKQIGIHLGGESKKTAIELIRQRVESRWENAMNTSFRKSLARSPLYCVKSAAWNESDHPRADDGKFGSGGGSSASTAVAKPQGKLSKIWGQVVAKFKPGAVSEPEDRHIPLDTVTPQSRAQHVGTIKAQLTTLGVKDFARENLHRAPTLRQHAITNPDLFDKHIEAVEIGLTQALHFGGDPILSDKLKEIERLKNDVNEFRAKHQPEVAPIAVDLQALPDHFKRKGAAKENTRAAAEHLAKGGDVKSAVAHVMTHGGLAEATAKRYVRMAVKEAAKAADANILALTTKVSHARNTRKPRKATGGSPRAQSRSR